MRNIYRELPILADLTRDLTDLAVIDLSKPLKKMVVRNFNLKPLSCFSSFIYLFIFFFLYPGIHQFMVISGRVQSTKRNNTEARGGADGNPKNVDGRRTKVD